VAPPADPEPVRIRDAVGDEQVDPVQQVGPLVGADRTGHHGRELVAVTLAAPRVGQEDRVARGGQPLHRRPPGAEELVGPAAVRPAVHQGDQRKRPIGPAPAGRQDEQAVEGEAIAGPVGQALLGAPPDPPGLRPGVADPL
jgi:hypothetical protein